MSMGERITPTSEQIAAVLEEAYTNGSKAPPDWLTPRLAGLMEVRNRLMSRGIPEHVATEAVLLSAMHLGSIFERAGFDMDPVPYRDPRRN